MHKPRADESEVLQDGYDFSTFPATLDRSARLLARFLMTDGLYLARSPKPLTFGTR